MSVRCEKLLGKWHVRVNGHFVAEFWRKTKAFEMAYYLAKALDAPPPSEQ